MQASPEGHISITGVSKYFGRHKALDNVSLEIPPGSVTVILGPSGSGKSTLLMLLARFYDPSAGDIWLDTSTGRQNLRDLKLEALRRQVGVVFEDAFLFAGTVAENIAYGHPQATMEDIRRAAAAAGASEFINALPKGFDTRLTERGTNLSGGQRQRIALARVLLKDAPILIMDEATSALDSEVEAAIQHSLDTLMTGKTVIAIAHRLSTIAAMDRLIVMDKGVIVEEGSHQELLQLGGIYAKLWAHQSGGFLSEPTEGHL